MKIKTINKVIRSKMFEWLGTIDDKKLREDVKDNLLVSGGSITSMLLKEQINDFDVYIQDMDVLLRLANYYCEGKVLDGRKKMYYLRNHIQECGIMISSEDLSDEEFLEEISSVQTERVVRYRNLKSDQVKLDIQSQGLRYDIDEDSKDKYIPVFLSQNAISLSNDLQIVLRFSGDAEQIHSTFDFIHATNYYTMKDGLVTNVQALESTITKELLYQGSKYPLTSIIRMKKFLLRGWSINAGMMLKAMFQISLLDLTDPDVLEEQLIGVDIAYFSELIKKIRERSADNNNEITSDWINDQIDLVFTQYEDDQDEIKPKTE